ncbi:MAG: hypothetical protein WBZ42_05445 [Halobacteriota archaeon]
MAVDLTDPTILAAIIGIAGAFIAGVLGALYVPLFNEWMQTRAQKKKLRRGLYRELVHWYENTIWQIKSYDRNHGEIGFFAPPVVGLRAPVHVGYSINQAEENPQIWRGDLKKKIIDLQKIFRALEEELLKTNLYAKTLEDDQVMQYFYQLNDSEIISNCYDNFRYAFEFQLPPYYALPTGRFLTSEEAKELSLLEGRLDTLRIACAAFEFHEDHEELDRSLLATMRRGRKRGTLVNAPETGRETSRWCLACDTYSDPVVFWALNKALVNELCEHCGKKLPTVNELSKILERTNADEKRKQATYALAKTYEYNRTEIKRDNVDRLVTALGDTLLEVREGAALALGNIGKRLGKIGGEQHKTADLRDPVVKALVKKLSDKGEDAKMKQAAAVAIAKIYKCRKKGAGVARKPLKLALQDSNDDIRRAAAGAVGNIGDQHLFLSLETSLSSAKSESAQEAIVIALGRLGKKSVQRLIEVMHDDKKPTLTRRTAASVLGGIGDPSEVWGPLNQVANDQSADPHLKVSAQSALRLLARQHEEVSFAFGLSI